MSKVLFLYRFHAKEVNSQPVKILRHFCGRVSEMNHKHGIAFQFALIADNTPDEIADHCAEVMSILLTTGMERRIVRTQYQPDGSRLLPDGSTTNGFQPKHFTHFVTSMQLAQELADENTAIFFCEDDYLYMEDALWKAYQMVLFKKGDFVSLYDGPSHYGDHLTVQALRADRPGYDLELEHHFGHHWRTGDSSCFTYVATMEALRRQDDFLLGMKGDWGDTGLWKGVWQNRKSKLWTSVPGMVYHNNSLNYDNRYWADLFREVMS